MFFLKHVLYKECLHQFCHGPILYPTVSTTCTSESLETLICVNLFSKIVLVSSTRMGLRRVSTYAGKCTAREKLSICEKNCRLLVVMQSPRHFMGRIYCGSGIAGGLDVSRVVLKVSHFQPKYQIQ